MIVAIPLVLSSITHLLNPLEFPGLHYDEGIYMRRSMHVIEGQGPQDPVSRFDHSQESTSSYDHPYFGQLLLASVLNAIGYPDLFKPDGTLESIQLLYLVPRILMGILAVVDTFLVYKIAEVRYNRNIALIASILFAVMPLGWLVRRIVLDSFLLPLLLTSVFFAIKYSKESTRITRNFNTAAIYILLSGIFLGLALFTKVPAITSMPLIVYLILGNNTLKRNLRALWLWFIPVILIPLIWPAVSITLGQTDQWLDALLWQAIERQQRGVLFALNAVMDIDPVLFILGIAGLIFTVAKKDLTMILWIVPYLALIYSVGWVTHFHWIPVLPALCIASAVFLNNLAKKVSGKSIVRKSLSTGIILTIFFFGFLITLVTITTNVSSHQYQAAEYILKSVKTNGGNKLATEEEVTIISSPMYSWLFKYPFEEKNVFSWFRDSSQPIRTERILLAVDTNYKGWTENRQGREDPNQIALLEKVYNITNTRAEFDANKITYDRNMYPYTGIGHGRIGASDVEIRTNY